MSLSSSSTNDEVRAALENNAGYEANASVSQAQAYLTALRILLLRTPQQMKVDGTEIWTNVDWLNSEIAKVSRFVAAARSGGSVRYLDSRGMRD